MVSVYLTIYLIFLHKFNTYLTKKKKCLNVRKNYNTRRHMNCIVKRIIIFILYQVC